MSNPNKYQRHIDGLRAVAVLSVIAYHFGQSFFSGGFVGVDVFFVISGYLITSLILDEINQTGDFNFKRFYIRRMRRLFPALAVTFIACTLCAYALFSPERFQAFGSSMSAAVFSVSNILFWSESGYFDADSHVKPLLHTWSLSVEEQFYFVWPALLWLTVRRASGRAQLSLLLIVGLASFGLNIVWVWGKFDAEYASTIFYLTPFRIFELVIGAMAIFIAPKMSGKRWVHELTMLLGLALITYAVLTYTDDIVFPYYAALPPCIGALLVILSNKATITGSLLTNRVAVGIGLISYSMYLIHWPAVVFYQYYLFQPLTQADYAGLFILTTGLSVLMYFFVEKTLRRNAPSLRNTAPQKVFVVSTLSAMMAIALAGVYFYATGGSTWRNRGAMPAQTVSTGMLERFQLVKRSCKIDQLGSASARHCDMERPYQLLVIGNSHEPDGYNIFTRVYAQNPQVHLISFGTLNGCKVTMTSDGPVSKMPYNRCAERTAALNDKDLIKNLDGVVVSRNKPFEPNSQISWQILQHLRDIDPELPIVVLGGYINTRYHCAELFNRFGSFDSCRDPRYISYTPFREQENNAGTWTQLDYLYLDKTALLCSQESVESCQIEADGEPAFYDGHHLSFSFAQMLGQRIVEHYSTALIEAGFPAPKETR